MTMFDLNAQHWSVYVNHIDLLWRLVSYIHLMRVRWQKIRAIGILYRTKLLGLSDIGHLHMACFSLFSKSVAIRGSQWHNAVKSIRSVRSPNNSWQTKWISWLLMPWILASPGYQQPWYGLCELYHRPILHFIYLCKKCVQVTNGFANVVISAIVIINSVALIWKQLSECNFKS